MVILVSGNGMLVFKQALALLECWFLEAHREIQGSELVPVSPVQYVAEDKQGDAEGANQDGGKCCGTGGGLLRQHRDHRGIGAGGPLETICTLAEVRVVAGNAAATIQTYGIAELAKNVGAVDVVALIRFNAFVSVLCQSVPMGASTSICIGVEKADVGALVSSTAVYTTWLMNSVKNFENSGFGCTMMHKAYVCAGVSVAGHERVRAPIRPVEPVFEQSYAERARQASTSDQFSIFTVIRCTFNDILVCIRPVDSLVNGVNGNRAGPQYFIREQDNSSSAVHIGALNEAVVFLDNFVPHSPKHQAIISRKGEGVQVGVSRVNDVGAVLECGLACLDVDPAIGEVNVAGYPINSDVIRLVDVFEKSELFAISQRHYVDDALIHFGPEYRLVSDAVVHAMHIGERIFSK